MKQGFQIDYDLGGHRTMIRCVLDKLEVKNEILEEAHNSTYVMHLEAPRCLLL